MTSVHINRCVHRSWQVGDETIVRDRQASKLVSCKATRIWATQLRSRMSLRILLNLCGRDLCNITVTESTCGTDVKSPRWSSTLRIRRVGVAFLIRTPTRSCCARSAQTAATCRFWSRHARERRRRPTCSQIHERSERASDEPTGIAANDEECWESFGAEEVCKPCWQRQRNARQRRHGCTPIVAMPVPEGPLARLVRVQVCEAQLAATHNVVVRDHDAIDCASDHPVAPKESDCEACRGVEQVEWASATGNDDCAIRTPAPAKATRAHVQKIVSWRDDICRYVNDQVQAEDCKSTDHTCPCRPILKQVCHEPRSLAGFDLYGSSAKNAHPTSENTWQWYAQDHAQSLVFLRRGQPGQICHVQHKRRVHADK
mmetsp:Transcript_82967/g.216206  ORF Transcript_82967/g.216206 Transcript_82967/m.216206 type:complete len:372 (+) Transcript_82967:79-1194(+)